MTNRLIYKLGAFFRGESGIVEIVETAPKKDEKGKSTERDKFGKLPQLVTFRNPLGVVVKKYSPKDYGYNHKNEYVFFYRTYKLGDKFP